MRRFALATIAAAFLVAPLGGARRAQFDYFLTGSDTNVSGATQSGAALMGGGTDVDALFTWMSNRARRWRLRGHPRVRRRRLQPVCIRPRELRLRRDAGPEEPGRLVRPFRLADDQKRRSALHRGRRSVELREQPEGHAGRRRDQRPRGSRRPDWRHGARGQGSEARAQGPGLRGQG
jgi:hypothetical protein